LHRVRAVTFDVGGTLDGPGIPWRPRFEALYRAAGLSEPDERLARAFYDADDHLAERHDLSRCDLAETVRLQVSDTLENLGRRDATLAEQVAQAFVREARSSFAAARPILEGLRREVRLGVVSNFYGNLAHVLRAEGLLGLFSVVMDSRACGLEKPDRRIFEAACRALEVSPRETAHVGDSLPRDVRGARDAGLIAIWYAPPSVDAVEEPGAVRIGSLAELTSLQVLAA
jgi:HAD superfamily hydrolase (TIGR01549 family)